jgi:1,2-diacylglycerol-3-alpha-glucose alpha-1,2-glucosyltransferase
LKINYISESEILGLKGLGPVTSYRQVMPHLKKLGIKITVNSKKPSDLIHVHSFGPYSYKIIKNSEAVKITTTHTLPVEMSMLYKGASPFQSIFNKYFKKFYSKSDFIFSPSNFCLNQLRKLGVKVPGAVVNNGVDLKKYKFSKERANKFRTDYSLENDKIITSVGLMSNRKGMKLFLDTAKLMPDHKFVWIGPLLYGVIQKDYFEMKRLMKNHPKNVLIPGYVDDIIGAYSASDTFFFPSPFETQGMVILEAAACKVPLVLNDIPTYDIYTSNKNCLKIRKPRQAKQAIQKIIKNKTLRNRLVRNGMNTAKDFRIEKTAKYMAGLYKAAYDGDLSKYRTW